MSDEAKPTPEPATCPKCDSALVGHLLKDVIAAKDNELTELERENAELRQQRDKLQAFKDWVHNWLDQHGVPTDPDPEHNAKTNCRIGGRLEWLRQRLDAAEKLLPFAQHERSCDIITASYLVPFPRCTCGLDGVRAALAQKVNAEQTQQNGGGA